MSFRHARIDRIPQAENLSSGKFWFFANSCKGDFDIPKGIGGRKKFVQVYFADTRLDKHISPIPKGIRVRPEKWAKPAPKKTVLYWGHRITDTANRNTPQGVGRMHRQVPTAVELVEKLSRESERQKIRIEQLETENAELRKQLDAEREKRSDVKS